MSSRFWFSSMVIVSISCGQANNSEGRGAASLPTNGPVAVTPVPANPVPVAPELVNLLTRSAVDIAVSSVYRSLSSQVAALVDGNLETAWNSATGQLVGSWIDIRLPESVTVSAIELTVGYTKVTPTSDLFTGNHRVTRVRVLRGGTEVGVFALDPQSRELQTLPISGPGGIYRIEVLEVVAGTRTNWREVCISELRVMGHSPDPSSPTSVPRFAVGSLPAPRVVPGTTDRSEVQRLLMVELPTFERLWSTLESDIRRYQGDFADPGIPTDEQPRLRRQRNRGLTGVQDLVQLVDQGRADAIRGVLARDFNVSDLALAAAAFESVLAYVDDDASRCAWERVYAGLLLARVADAVSYQRQVDEMDEAMGESAPTGPDLSSMEAETEHLSSRWRRSPETVVARVLTLDLRRPVAAADLAELKRVAGLARNHCGWTQ